MNQSETNPDRPLSTVYRPPKTVSYPGYYNNLPRTFRCGTHPDREGVGICVSCRSVVCVECSTRVDRMNYCIRCLQSAAQPAGAAQQVDPGRETFLGLPLLLGSFLLSIVVFAAFGFLMALLRQGAGGGVTTG